ncbi:MAG TPA: hypothetical protein VGL54_07545 [Solirubrobacteraceae bacterium]|jgi:presenilin-like A22 family membrane protease
MASAIREREEADRRARGVVVTHPNRDKAVVQSTRVVVILLMLATIALLLINTIGGWKVLQGALPVQLAFIVVYILMIYSAVRWSRGVLPLAAALGVLLTIFALVAAPSWFERNEAGFAQPLLNTGLIGVVTLLVIPVQMLLVAFALRGFNQGWNVEVERRDPSAGPNVGTGAGPGIATGDYPDASPFPA